MSNPELSDEQYLKDQINQLREAITSVENQENGVPSIQPNELWRVMKMNLDEDQPIHPRIGAIINGHVDVNEVKKGLRRLENDLHDVQNIEEEYEYYDPSPNKISDKKEKSDSSEEYAENEEDTTTRDKNQRPLSAYKHGEE